MSRMHHYDDRSPPGSEAALPAGNPDRLEVLFEDDAVRVSNELEGMPILRSQYDEEE